MTQFEATSCQQNYQRSSLFLFVLSVVLLVTQICPANASDDLLDPGKIGAGRKAVKSEGLLDPTLPIAKTVRSTAATNRPSGKHHPSSYARGMAGSVVSSLDSLTHAAANLI